MGTRIGRQELNAEILTDNPDALWQAADIENNRVALADMPDLVRIVVGVDPAVTAKANSDETGIIVAGKDDAGHAYVLADASLRGSPSAWAQAVVRTYNLHKADRVIGEVNNGGDLVEANLRTESADISFTAVHASRGKAIRAEPIAALYEQGRVHHAGSFPELEDQLCGWNPTDPSAKSPDRVDALVWAITALKMNKSGIAMAFA